MSVPIPTFKPTCSWCGEQLQGLPFPLPAKGTGRCPIGGIMVDFEVEIDQTVGENGEYIDKNGEKKIATGWKVSSPKH